MSSAGHSAVAGESLPPDGLQVQQTLPGAYNPFAAYPGAATDGSVTLYWNGHDAFAYNHISYPSPRAISGALLLDPSAAVAYGGNGSDWLLITEDGRGREDDQSFTLAGGTFTADGVVHGADFASTPAFGTQYPSENYSTVYSYDLDNNRTKSVHAGPGDGASETITYAYNGDDELIGQTSSLSGTTTNHYDANGSLTTSTSNGTTTAYTYDARNKLVAYAVGGATLATYVYDDDGDRVAETTTAGGVSTTTLYLTDTQNPTGYDQPVEQKTTANSAPTMTYVLGDRVLAQADGSGQVSYLLVDGHGSTQQLTNAAGVVTAAYRYDDFGTAINFTADSAGTVFLFGGDAVYDRTSGLYLHGNGTRPTDGFIFIQRDSASGRNADPIGLHKYIYADDEPISRVDPSGKDGLSDEAFADAGDYKLEELEGLQTVDAYVQGSFGAVVAAAGLDLTLIQGGLGGNISSYLKPVSSAISAVQNLEHSLLYSSVRSTLNPLELNDAVSNNFQIYVIGRQVDTAQYEGQAGYEVLNDPNWNLSVNDAWVEAAIKNESPVLLATDPGVDGFFNADSSYFGTVYAREVDQLMEAGYTFETIEDTAFLLPL